MQEDEELQCSRAGVGFEQVLGPSVCPEWQGSYVSLGGLTTVTQWRVVAALLTGNYVYQSVSGLRKRRKYEKALSEVGGRAMPPTCFCSGQASSARLCVCVCARACARACVCLWVYVLRKVLFQRSWFCVDNRISVGVFVVRSD
jgi:hypothetical protein